MNVSATNPAFGISLLASDRPASHAKLAEAIGEFYEVIGRPPTGIHTLTKSGKVSHRAYRPESLQETFTDPKSLSTHVGSVTNPDEIVIDCFLRPHDSSYPEFETRWVMLTGQQVSMNEVPIQAFMSAIARLYPIAHGGVGAYRSLAYAAQESSFSGAFSPSELDADTRARLKEDQMCRTQFVRKLRRLYPVTIIGPEIWAQLPPMPKVEPAPNVEDLGNCKMLTVWPELVEPRDPAFLAGTTELRRWLWPFTIQNPADAIEEP